MIADLSHIEAKLHIMDPSIRTLPDSELLYNAMCLFTKESAHNHRHVTGYVSLKLGAEMFGLGSRYLAHLYNKWCESLDPDVNDPRTSTTSEFITIHNWIHFMTTSVSRYGQPRFNELRSLIGDCNYTLGEAAIDNMPPHTEKRDKRANQEIGTTSVERKKSHKDDEGGDSENEDDDDDDVEIHKIKTELRELREIKRKATDRMNALLAILQTYKTIKTPAPSLLPDEEMSPPSPSASKRPCTVQNREEDDDVDDTSSDLTFINCRHICKVENCNRPAHRTAEVCRGHKVRII